MGKFSKKDKVSEFFETMRQDTENERNKINPTLNDFTKEEEFVTGTFTIDFGSTDSENSGPLNAIKNKVQKFEDDSQYNNQEIVDNNQEESDDIKNETLLQKCKSYTHDDDGNDFSIDNSPIYELKSIADILKSDSMGAIENLSKKYNVKITDETDKSKINKVEFDKNTEEDSNQSDGSSSEVKDEQQKTSAFIKMVNDSKNAESKKSDDEIFEDYFLDNNPETVIDDLETTVPDISDIDNTQKIKTTNSFEKTKETTIKFIPVKDPNKSKPHISVSSMTGKIANIKTNNIAQDFNLPKTKLESNEFDDFSVQDEIDNLSKAKAYFIKFSKRKRLGFFQCILSFLCLVALIINFIPSFFEKFTINPKPALFMCLIIFAINVIANIDIFTSYKNLFNKYLKPDVSIATASLSILTIFFVQIYKNVFDNALETFYIVLMASFILFIRSIITFCNISSKIKNLKVIMGKNDKTAISFIDDQSTTFAMAKNSIDGDVLVAAPQKVGFVNDFNKYYDYNTILNGKYCYFQIIGILLAVLSTIIGYIYFGNLVLGLFCSSVVLLIISLPISFFINTLPMYSATKKLYPFAAMISGVEGAKQIEASNALVIESTELFPEGSIILKDMKVLSENNIDDTILRAASLTEAVGSTLTPIFKQIAKTNSTYVLPDSDTVKYEDRLGLSGWVDNELLFIGNRTLLESHGISVPSVELDKKILKNGFFPIYVATVQKACALIIVKYVPLHNISKELKKVSNLGVTLLVENHDPNINEEMIADYFGIYEDTIKIMSNSGVSMYKNSVLRTENTSAPAAFRFNNLSIVRIINASTSIKRSNLFLNISYVLFSVLLAVGFIYNAFARQSLFPIATILLVIEVAVTLLSTIIYLFKKP